MDTCFMPRTPCSSSILILANRKCPWKLQEWEKWTENPQPLSFIPDLCSLVEAVLQISTDWGVQRLVSFSMGSSGPSDSTSCVLSPDNSAPLTSCSQSWSHHINSSLISPTLPLCLSVSCSLPDATLKPDSDLSPLIVLLHHLWESGHNIIRLIDNQNQGSVRLPRTFYFIYRVLPYLSIVRNVVSIWQQLENYMFIL